MNSSSSPFYPFLPRALQDDTLDWDSIFTYGVVCISVSQPFVFVLSVRIALIQDILIAVTHPTLFHSFNTPGFTLGIPVLSVPRAKLHPQIGITTNRQIPHSHSWVYQIPLHHDLSKIRQDRDTTETATVPVPVPVLSISSSTTWCLQYHEMETSTMPSISTPTPVSYRSSPMNTTSTPPPQSSSSFSHPRDAHHQSRASTHSLYDLLADLDESQLHYLISEMNHTAVQNMAVSQAVSAIETKDPSHSLSVARANMTPPTMQRQLSKSQKLRLSLQTVFRSASVRQQQRQQQQHTPSQNADDDGIGYPEDDNALLQTPTTRRGRRRSPAYKRISRPTFNLPPGVTIADLLNLLEAEFLYHASSGNSSSSQLSPSSSSFSPSSSFSDTPSPTPSSSHGSSLGRIRRYPSTIDMALEAERSASGVEGIGLGMLEPRPTTPACGSPGSARGSPSPNTPVFERRVLGRRRTPSPSPPPQLQLQQQQQQQQQQHQQQQQVAPPVVLEGIFEVLESR